MAGTAAGYYFWPPAWFGGLPSSDPDHVTLRDLQEEVLRRSLASGIDAKVLRSGVFVFDFVRWVPHPNRTDDEDSAWPLSRSRMQQLRVLNVHLACLHSAIREKSGIALPLTLVSPSTLIQGDSIAWQSYGTGDDRFVRDSMEPVSRFFRLLHFDIDVLSLSFDLLSDILDKKDQEAIHLTDLHARSFAAWQEEDFALSLILAWAIIERMIQTIWTEHVAANRERIVDGSPITFINKNRREKLAAGRDFTASVISEILSLEELISFSVYESIERARKARNGWLHALVAVGGNDAMTAVSVAETLLKQVKALRLGLALNSVD